MRITIFLLIEEYHISGEHFDTKVNVYPTRVNATKAYQNRRDELIAYYEHNHPGEVGCSQNEDEANKAYLYDEYVEEGRSEKFPRFDIWNNKESTEEFNSLRLIKKRVTVRSGESTETENNKQ